MKCLLLKCKKASSTIWPAMLWSTLTFGLQMIPRKNLPSHNMEIAQDQMIPVPFFDKFNHIFFYSVLLVLWSIYISRKWNGKLTAWSMTIISSVVFSYGVVIEYLQVYIGRDFNFEDVVANMIGIIAGIAATFFINKNPGK